MTTATATATQPLTATTHFLGDTAVLTGRSLRHITRSLDTIITTAIMPIAFMLLFVFVFGGAIDTGSDVAYVDYLLPGILLITVASGVSYTAYRLFLDLQGGIFERFQSMPIARSSVLWAHVLTSLVANLVSLAIVVGVAFLMGFRTGADLLAWLGVAETLELRGPRFQLFVGSDARQSVPQRNDAQHVSHSKNAGQRDVFLLGRGWISTIDHPKRVDKAADEAARRLHHVPMVDCEIETRRLQHVGDVAQQPSAGHPQTKAQVSQQRPAQSDGLAIQRQPDELAKCCAGKGDGRVVSWRVDVETKKSDDDQ